MVNVYNNPTPPDSGNPMGWIIGLIIVVIVLVLLIWAVPRLWNNTPSVPIDTGTNIINNIIPGTGTPTTTGGGGTTSTTTR